MADFFFFKSHHLWKERGGSRAEQQVQQSLQQPGEEIGSKNGPSNCPKEVQVCGPLPLSRLFTRCTLVPHPWALDSGKVMCLWAQIPKGSLGIEEKQWGPVVERPWGKR